MLSAQSPGSNLGVAMAAVVAVFVVDVTVGSPVASRVAGDVGEGETCVTFPVHDVSTISRTKTTNLPAWLD